MADNFTPQNLTFIYNDEVYPLDLNGINNFQKYYIRFGNITGISMGTAGVMFLLLWILSKNRKAPIFILNQISLSLLVIKSILYFAYLLGPFCEVSYFIVPYSVANSYQVYEVSLAASIFDLFIKISVLISLIYQIHVIFKGQNNQKLRIILVSFMVILLLAVFALGVCALIYFSNQYQSQFEAKIVIGSWVTDMPFIIFSASVNVASIIFIFKLIFAIRSRKVLGLKQFSIYHILVIFSAQTLVIPSILLIVNYTNVSPYIPSICQMLIVISSPLSSMWAASANNAPIPTSSASLSFISREKSNATDYSNETIANDYKYFSKSDDIEKQHFVSVNENTYDGANHSLVSAAGVTKGFELSIENK